MQRLRLVCASVRVVQPAHHQAVEPVDHPAAAVGDQLDLLDVAGLEPHRCAARQVQPHAVRLHAVEDQRPVDLEEVVVRPDLHRPVARVVDAQRHDGQARVELEVGPVEDVFAGNHVLPPRNREGMEDARPIVSGSDRGSVTSLVPSGKVGSTWIIGDHLGHAVHDVVAAEDLAAGAHDLGDGLAVAGHLEQLGRDQGHRLGDVQLQAALLARPGRPGRPRRSAACRVLAGTDASAILQVIGSSGDENGVATGRASRRQGVGAEGLETVFRRASRNARTSQVARTNGAVRAGSPSTGTTR